MQKEVESYQSINIIDGELWYHGQYLAQVTSCKMEIDVKTTAISQIQNLIDEGGK